MWRYTTLNTVGSFKNRNYLFLFLFLNLREVSVILIQKIRGFDGFFFLQCLAKFLNCSLLQLDLQFVMATEYISMMFQSISMFLSFPFGHTINSILVKWREINSVFSHPLSVVSENITVSVNFEYVINTFVSNGYSF